MDDSIDTDFSREASPVERDTPVFWTSSHKYKQAGSELSVKTERKAENAQRKRIKKVVASSEDGESYSRGLYLIDFKTVDDLRSRRSPKPQLSRSLKRRSSVSMPGSLFPRSPSMEPDVDPSAAENEQRVRFSLHIAQTSDPQSPQRQKSSSSRGSPFTSGSPRCRSQMVSSVKTTVDKFRVGEDDADPSILLPSPKRSPLALVASRNLQSRRMSNPSSPSAVATKHKRKKHSVESFLDDCDDTSGFLRVNGKEELIAIREGLYENESHDNETPTLSIEQAEHHRNGDKIRIKMLEEEIERLKREVSGYFMSGISMLTCAISYRRDRSPLRLNLKERFLHHHRRLHFHRYIYPRRYCLTYLLQPQNLIYLHLFVPP